MTFGDLNGPEKEVEQAYSRRCLFLIFSGLTGRRMRIPCRKVTSQVFSEESDKTYKKSDRMKELKQLLMKYEYRLRMGICRKYISKYPKYGAKECKMRV